MPLARSYHAGGLHYTALPSSALTARLHQHRYRGLAGSRKHFCCLNLAKTHNPIRFAVAAGSSSVGLTAASAAVQVPVPGRTSPMKTRKLNGAFKMDPFRRKYPNHTEIAYRQAVSKLKYLLSETYAPRVTLTKPMISSRRPLKENLQQCEDYQDDVDAQSVFSDVSKKEPSTRSKITPSRLNNYAMHANTYPPGPEKLNLPPAELSTYIERQEEYIDQLEKESHYCREELKNLVEKVREVVAENEALQDKSKSSYFKSMLDSHQPAGHYDDEPATKRDYEESSSSHRLLSSKRLEGPSIVFESRISELEAQLTQARLELRKAREQNQDSLTRLTDRRDESQLQLELERASREKRDFEARLEELQRELSKTRARDTDVELKSKRALEVAQQAEFEKVQAEVEVRRLREELERRQEKLREALQETNRRIIEEKQQVERRFSQQMEQLSADVASHWEAASKSHLEAEKQRREIAELKRDQAQKQALIDDLKKELQQKIAKLQEELNSAIAERDAARAELATTKNTLERNDRQARQEQSRLQAEIESYKTRSERADADLTHARRENIRLSEEIAALEKEINMNKIMEETRVGVLPTQKSDKKDDKDKDKELASLIYDLENKQAKTVASLEDSLSKQASLVTNLTAECQSLTQRLEANDQKHKEEMANLQSNLEYLSDRIKGSFELKKQDSGEDFQAINDGTELISSGETSNFQESNNNTITNEKYNLDLTSQARQHQFENQSNGTSVDESHGAYDPTTYVADQPMEEQNYSDQQQNYAADDYSTQQYGQYDQYDPSQYQDYYNNQQYDTSQEFPQDHQQYNSESDQQYSQNEQYPHNEQYLEKEVYKDETYNEQNNTNNYPNE